MQYTALSCNCVSVCMIIIKCLYMCVDVFAVGIFTDWQQKLSFYHMYSYYVNPLFVISTQVYIICRTVYKEFVCDFFLPLPLIVFTLTVTTVVHCEHLCDICIHTSSTFESVVSTRSIYMYFIFYVDTKLVYQKKVITCHNFSWMDYFFSNLMCLFLIVLYIIV